MFLADAADSLDRVGYTALAADCLERAQRDPQNAAAAIAMAECALLARHGDPELAEERLAVVERLEAAPAPAARVLAGDAFCAPTRRCGAATPSAGGLAARAFEAGGAAGSAEPAADPRARAHARRCSRSPCETGSPAALALEASSLPMALTRARPLRADARRAGRCALAAGQGQQLLKLVAVRGGKVHAEQAIEALWPEVRPEAGRNRLRTVLGTAARGCSRGRRARGRPPRSRPRACGSTSIAVPSRGARGTGTRARRLDRGRRRRALARSPATAARSSPTTRTSRGPTSRASSARQTMLNLLDLCAAAATERGDLDETRRIIERTIELAPYDDDRYLRVALILHEQGKKGAALSVLYRARSALAQLGVDPPPKLARARAVDRRGGDGPCLREPRDARLRRGRPAGGARLGWDEVGWTSLEDRGGTGTPRRGCRGAPRFSFAARRRADRRRPLRPDPQRSPPRLLRLRACIGDLVSDVGYWMLPQSRPRSGSSRRGDEHGVSCSSMRLVRPGAFRSGSSRRRCDCGDCPCVSAEAARKAGRQVELAGSLA